MSKNWAGGTTVSVRFTEGSVGGSYLVGLWSECFRLLTLIDLYSILVVGVVVVFGFRLGSGGFTSVVLVRDRVVGGGRCSIWVGRMCPTRVGISLSISDF